MKKDCRLEIRVLKEEHKKIKLDAKSRGMTMTALIVSRLKDMPVKDYTIEKDLLKIILEFTKEVNLIGKNINQVTIALHQINQSKKIATSEFADLNLLINQFLLTREQFGKTIETLIYR